MRTIEDPAVAASRRARLVRDLRVLRRMLGLVRGYVVAGGLVRRRYRQKLRRGDVFFVDEELRR